MRNKRSLLSATLIAMHAILPAAAVHSADYYAKPIAAGETVKKQAPTAIGRAPLRLQGNPNCPYTFTIEPQKRRSFESGTLLSIDSIYLKGKNDREIEKLLEGPVDSSVEIGYLDSYFAPKTIKLTREQMDGVNRNALTDLRQTISLRDYERNVFAGDSRRAEDAEAQNLDLIARAYSSDSVEGALSLPGPKTLAIGLLAARAVIASDMIGDTATGDRYLQLVLKNPEFDWRFDDVDTDSYKLVTHLIMTGRLKEAQALCHNFLEIAERNGKKQLGANPGIEKPLALRQLLLQVLMAEGGQEPKKEALALANALFDEVGTREGYWASDSLKVLAKQLEERGEYTRASQVYEHRLKNEQLKKVPNEDAHPGLQLVQNYCNDSYHLALLQDKLKQPHKAIAIAQKALEDYDTFLTPEQQTIAEQLDEYFPNGSDLELLLARLYLSSNDFAQAQQFAQKAVTRIETALGPKSATLAKALDLSALAADATGQKSVATKARARLVSLERPSSFVETSDPEKFVLLKAATTAVEKGDKDAKNKIDRLVKIYDAQGPIHDWKRRPLNLFAALSSLCRRLSDKGMIAESHALLDKIAVIAARDEFTPVACKFLDVEKAYNQKRRNKDAQVVWPQFAEKEVVSQMVQDCGAALKTTTLVSAALVEQENFRVLAEIYGDAGEAKRSAFFIDLALAAANRAQSAAHAGGDAASPAVARTKVILLLDAARLRARAGQQAEAHKLGEQAISLCAATVPDRSHDGRSFNEKYRFKVVELARIFKISGDSDKTVAQFLVDVRNKLESGATVDMPTDERVSRYYGGFYSLIDGYLAQLMFSSGQTSEALPVVRKAVEKCGNNVRGTLRYLAGQIMEANRLYGEAAHQYNEGSQFASMDIPIYQRKMETLCLSAAATCAEKDNTMKDSERANIYMRLATTLEGEEPRQALRLYQNASTLIPDSEEGKSRLVQKMNNLKSIIATLDKTAAAKKDTLGEAAQPPANPTAQPTPQELHALEVSSAKDGVEVARELALLNEKGGRPAAASSWFQLAWTEANAEMPGKSVEDFRHGLKIYQNTTDSIGFYNGMIASRSDTIPSLWLAKSLTRLGHAKDGEDLIQESIQATTRAFGFDSPVTANQMAQLFSFYIEQKRDEDALKVLDQILDLNMSALDVGQMSARVQMTEQVQNLVHNNRKSMAFKVLDKELAAERRSLDTDDKRIADTLTEIAKLQDDVGQSTEAVKNLTDALTTYTKYVGAINLGSTPGAYIVQIWKKDGQADADKTVRLRHIRVNTALLRKFGNAQLADRIEKDDKWPEGLVDPNHSQENRQSDSREASSTEQIVWWQKELQEACLETPYSSRAAKAAGTVMNCALQQRNWRLLAESATTAAKIYEHTPDTAAGRSWGCTPPDHTRMQYYSNAILAFVHLDKLDEAQKWIDRADKHMVCKTCYEYIQLAMHELDCGDRVKAQKFAELSDANFTDQYSAVVPHQSLTVWKLLGHPERGEALVRKAAEFKAKSDAQSKRAQDSAFKYVGF